MMLRYVHFGSHDPRGSRQVARDTRRALAARRRTSGSFSIPSPSRIESTETVQLLTRHWVITDGTGHIEEVRGPGVVGKQPTLEPGESFEYTSGARCHAVRLMEGTYQMITRRRRFDAKIAPFTLSEPYTVHY